MLYPLAVADNRWQDAGEERGGWSMTGNAGREHHYDISVRWTGNRGEGTASYRTYGRDHQIQAGGKPGIGGSSDPAFRGDAGRYNPEELFLAAVSACHMLMYLHLCADAGVVVTSYEDEAGRHDCRERRRWRPVQRDRTQAADRLGAWRRPGAGEGAPC